MRVKALADPVKVEPPRSGEDASDCVACNTPDDAYVWVSERWRVRAMDRPTGLPMVLILECRSHLDLGDLPNLLAAELGVMTVRLERAIRSLDDVARVHVNRWGDGSAHLHMWFLARPYGRLQLRGTFLSLWDDILPVIPEQQWRENLALVAAWLGEFGGRAIAEPAHIQWQSPSKISESPSAQADPDEPNAGAATATSSWRPTDLADVPEGAVGPEARNTQLASTEEVDINERSTDDADPVRLEDQAPSADRPAADSSPEEPAHGWTEADGRLPLQRDSVDVVREPSEAGGRLPLQRDSADVVREPSEAGGRLPLQRDSADEVHEPSEAGGRPPLQRESTETEHEPNEAARS